MLPPDSTALAMVSGGGDSVALLHVLGALADERGFALSVLHVNHLLRGADSDADEEFVRELAGSLGHTCRVERVDVGALAAREGLNLEDAGRRVRYRLADEELDARCDAAGIARSAGRIAVAHTRDDRLETFLMRLAQGAGATGLTSLRPVRGRVVRPLLGASRAEVRDALGRAGLTWREDASNEDGDRLRVSVRHELLPLLREINPRVDEALARALVLLEGEDALLAEMGDSAATESAEFLNGEVRFDRERMAALPVPLRRRTVRAALSRAFPEVSRLDFAHIETVVRAVAPGQAPTDLAEGLRVFDEYGTMVVARMGEGLDPVALCLLSVPGTVEFGSAGRLTAETVDPSDVTCTADSAVIDIDAVRGPLSVGRACEGDRMRPLGMTGTKKLSDVFVDAKVPRRVRRAVPVVRDGDVIVWLAGIRMAEDYKVTPETTRATRLTWERGPECEGL